MKRSVSSLLLAAIAVLVLYPQCAQAQVAASDQRESCRKFVQEFYDWYVSIESRKPPPHQPSAQEIVLGRRAEFLSPVLLAALKEDEAASAKNPDDIVGLDFDPYLNAQDIAGAYTAGQPVLQGNTYRVPIYQVRGKIQASKPLLFAELSLSGVHWQFVNFHYDVDGKPYDLLSMLKSLREEREKDPTVHK